MRQGAADVAIGKHPGLEKSEVVTKADAIAALGTFDGLYEPGYLERLRSEERT